MQREVILGDAMVLDPSLLGSTPEPLQTVHIDLAREERHV